MPEVRSTGEHNQLSPMRRMERLWAHVRVFLMDHGIFRSLFYSNFHQLSPRAFRSSQPSPRQLRSYFQHHRIRTVLSLRGMNLRQPFIRLEAEACAEHEVSMKAFTLRSRDLPTREEILALRHFLTQLEYPVLFHCKSGADRAGLMSVLYLHFQEGVPIVEARKQLRLWPFGHIRLANTGILDFFFDSYLAYEARHPEVDFLTWVDTVYDPKSLRQSFRPHLSLNWITDKLLRRE